VKAAIVRTELRGPKSAMYTMWLPRPASSCLLLQTSPDWNGGVCSVMHSPTAPARRLTRRCVRRYVLHVKTAFHVRGVSRRYSDFVVLDKKLRARFPAAPELRGRSSIIGTLSPSFVQERRQLLQEYLDALLTDHQLAHCAPPPPSLLLPLPVSLLYTHSLPPYCCPYPCPYCTLTPSLPSR
jgi:hypothetical protein